MDKFDSTGLNVIKLITSVMYKFCNKLVFVFGKPFQPSLAPNFG